MPPKIILLSVITIFAKNKRNKLNKHLCNFNKLIMVVMAIKKWFLAEYLQPTIHDS